jgi:hypothetical protein
VKLVDEDTRWYLRVSRAKLRQDVRCNIVVADRPGHEIPRTETELKNTENQTEKYRTEEIRYLFGSQFLGTERTEVNSVLNLGLPNSRNGTELANSPSNSLSPATAHRSIKP